MEPINRELGGTTVCDKITLLNLIARLNPSEPKISKQITFQRGFQFTKGHIINQSKAFYGKIGEYFWPFLEIRPFLLGWIRAKAINHAGKSHRLAACSFNFSALLLRSFHCRCTNSRDKMREKGKPSEIKERIVISVAIKSIIWPQVTLRLKIIVVKH